MYAWCKKGAIPMVKHGGGPVLNRVFCYYLMYQAILSKIVKPSVQRLELDDHWTFQQDDHPKFITEEDQQTAFIHSNYKMPSPSSMLCA
uniref:Uncharacterized protein n=1 Tax=Sinocyclocheilus rhinocerous TaxID=307959 RepID=A0A673NJL0_9TELE